MAAEHAYITAEQLAGFDKYKYSAVDTNPLSVYILHPFWNFVVKLFPKWVAPNLLTFSGFLLLVFNFFILAYYDWDFYASAPGQVHVPGWVWILAGILSFLAYTLDGIDGKQARRTGSSTPLGELFDHGLDSWACLFFGSTVYSIFGRGQTGVSLATMHMLLWVVLFSFILSHWEKYNTGVLFLPWGYDISQVTISIVYIVTAVVGVEAWHQDLPFGLLYRDLFLFMLLGGAFLVTLPQSLFNLHKAHKAGTLKKDTLWEAMLPMVSPTLLFVLTSAWVWLSPERVVDSQPRVFYWLVGTLFSNITCKLIVCQMSSTRCQPLNWLLAPLACAVAFVATFQPKVEVETAVLFGMTALVTAAHIHYGVCVVRQLCRHFGIRAFSLAKPNSD
ncbi:ethanolaminephosphotransferase 1 [Lethenteron reissneri]|uniref:ethanolaminephosphotransferase 1 n=1 Tax=Lethenteron reissneri TaxID=7753 RepID=UPI002AB658E2|nr:ethanolaminephosphotransferase 1 [Lethenteron reissneri]